MRTNKIKGWSDTQPNSNKDDFRTPPYLWEWIKAEYGPIDYDGACEDGVNNLAAALRLEDKWPEGSTVYSNPPFDSASLVKWLKKGRTHTFNGGTHIMLMPMKLCQVALSEYIISICDITFLGGRINFVGPYSCKGGSSRNGCVVVVQSFKPHYHNNRRIRGMPLNSIPKVLPPPTR